MPVGVGTSVARHQFRELEAKGGDDESVSSWINVGITTGDGGSNYQLVWWKLPAHLRSKRRRAAYAISRKSFCAHN